MKKIGDGRIELTTKEEVIEELKKGKRITYNPRAIISCLFSPSELVSLSIFQKLREEKIIQEVKSSRGWPTTNQEFTFIQS